MRVYILVEIPYDNPENVGATACATKEAAEQAMAKAIAENGDSDEFVYEIIEADLR